jgi:uncharacterized protein (DUF362 family)
MSNFTVRAVRCLHTSTQTDVEAAVRRITEPLTRSWARLEKARRIAIKANIVLEPENIRLTNGRRQELVDDLVLRAVLRLLRERTQAQLFLVDSTYHSEGPKANYDVHFLPLLKEFDVGYVECSRQPLARYEVPGGGTLFQRYQFNPCFRDSDAFISVATLKSHAFMGVTLTTKNLFGLCPVHPQNRPRRYFHHLIRLPFVLADLGRTLQPCLNIIDGLVGQSRREWGGDARVTDTLIAGDHCIATDACAATLMGHDPASDWPTPPFRRDRSHLRIAADAGYGTVDLKQIDFAHNLTIPVGDFDSEPTDPREMVENWRRTTCEQALFFRDHRDEFLRKYPGEYIYLQEGVVLWHDPIRQPDVSRRQLSGARKGSGIWVKYVDPDETEGERFEVYEREMAKLSSGKP